ncbi:hypothetical protein GG344DRAFT_19325, partial [Lentinula edodes]
GGGFERSVLLLLFQKYFEKRFEELCTPLIDCYYTLSTVPMSSTTPISETKRRDLGLFGATVALALVNGYLPEKLNPLLLVYFLSDCQFECLNRTAVMDLFPELGATIDDWLSTPHDDDSNLNRFRAHFATYHNMETSALTNRTQEMHNTIAHCMLHNATIGPAEIDHPYFQAFIKGFRLPCKNHYTLPQASSIIAGECVLIYGVIDFTQLRGSSLPIRYFNQTTESTNMALQNAYRVVFGGEFVFDAWFEDFLLGVGTPCPTLLNCAKDRFNSMVKLEDISESTFRLRSFAWAISGVPRRILDYLKLEVYLVEDDDDQYGPGEGHSASLQQYLLHGTCSFRTCLREMRIPASYLIQLLKADYSPRSEPATAYQAIHNWLLLQILEAIGDYTII